MAQVEITPGERIPAVCVITGQPTADIVRVRGVAVPRWVMWLLPVGGFLAYLVAGSNTSTRYDLLLPCDARVLERRRRRSHWAAGTWALGIVVTAILLLRWPDLAGVGWSVIGLAMVGAVANQLTSSPGVWVGEGDRLVVSRVHPAFRDAVLAASSRA